MQIHHACLQMSKSQEKCVNAAPKNVTAKNDNCTAFNLADRIMKAYERFTCFFGSSSHFSLQQCVAGSVEFIEVFVDWRAQKVSCCDYIEWRIKMFIQQKIARDGNMKLYIL